MQVGQSINDIENYGYVSKLSKGVMKYDQIQSDAILFFQACFEGCGVWGIFT